MLYLSYAAEQEMIKELKELESAIAELANSAAHVRAAYERSSEIPFVDSKLHGYRYDLTLKYHKVNEKIKKHIN